MKILATSRLLKTIVFLISGLVLLYFGYKEKQSVSNYKMNDTTVTVIDLSKKDNGVNVLIILGVILITIALFITIIELVSNFKKDSKVKLTNQERNIISLIEQGKTNKEIATELSVSVSTIKTHINNIYKKVKVKSREELCDVLKN